MHRGIIARRRERVAARGRCWRTRSRTSPQRHAADQITKQLVANGFLGLLGAMLGNDPGGARTAQAGARVLAGGYMLKFSRDDEREAERSACKSCSAPAGIRAACRSSWRSCAAQQGRDPGSVEVFLSSHPAPAERAAALRRPRRHARAGAATAPRSAPPGRARCDCRPRRHEGDEEVDSCAGSAELPAPNCQLPNDGDRPTSRKRRRGASASDQCKRNSNATMPQV